LSGQTYLISERDFEKEGRDVVVAIRAASMHCQTEIHFGWSGHAHHRQLYQILGSVSPSGVGSSSMATRVVPSATRMRKSAAVRPALSWTSLYCHTMRRPAMGCTRVIR